MAVNDTGLVEVDVDLGRRRLTSRFSGFIKLDDALKAQRLYAEGLKRLNGRGYTALTYFSDLRVLSPEAAHVFEDMVKDAGQHNCVRAARVMKNVKSVAKMQLDRLESNESVYESRFFDNEHDAIRYLSEREMQL